MRTPFLENKAHTFTIAKIAIIFQSMLTILVCASLLTMLTSTTFPRDLLLWLLYADCLFVVLHLTYRIAYRGPKVALTRNEKKVLILHSLSSLVALCLTVILVKQWLQIGMYYAPLLLSLWLISLTSGIIFFKQKYFR